MSSATTRQAGITARLRRALYAESRREFYAHYDDCPSCKPTHRCQVGEALQDAYTVTTLAAGVICHQDRRHRETALAEIKGPLRERVKARAEEMWPRRQELQSTHQHRTR